MFKVSGVNTKKFATNLSKNLISQTFRKHRAGTNNGVNVGSPSMYNWLKICLDFLS